MGKSQRLSQGEMRAAFRLLSDLRELRHDRPALHQHLVEQLVHLVGGTGGFIADIEDWRENGQLRVTSFIISQAGAEAVADTMRRMMQGTSPWDDPTFAKGVTRTAPVEVDAFDNLMQQTRDATLSEFPVYADAMRSSDYQDHLVAWHQFHPDPIKICGVSIHRYGKRSKLFRGKEVALARLVFEELHWMTATGRLASPVTGYEKLTGRQREVLSYMLDGKAPKQITIELGISLHTTRDHIKRIYEVLGVKGREELTALFLRRGK